MRLKEIIINEDDYNNELVNEVISLLSAISAEGLKEISIENLLNDLLESGFPLDEDSLKELLNSLSIVTDVTDDGIVTISTTSDDEMGDDFDMPHDDEMPGDEEGMPGEDDPDIEEINPDEIPDGEDGGLPPEDEMSGEEDEDIEIDDENYSTTRRIDALAQKKATDDISRRF